MSGSAESKEVKAGPLFLLLLLAGCEQTARTPARAAIEVTDHANRTVGLAAPARRVISLVPAVTDMILELGAADRLVARTQFDTDVRLAALPSTGNALTPSLEWVTSLQPDLVISWLDQPSRSVVGRLAELGIPVYAARTESIADVLRTTRDLGKLLGKSAQAEQLATNIAAQLDSVHKAVADRAATPMVFLISLDPPMAAGNGTFTGELIRVAGGRNVFADSPMLWPQVSLEEIIQRKPTVIVLSQEDTTPLRPPLRTRPGWREIDAVKAGRVFVVDANMFNRPGPRLPEMARQLVRILHPSGPG
jgi:cobalamin transport system substrate-binding protein